MANLKKEVIVQKIKEELKNYKVVGIVSLENLPAAQLQQLRHRLRGTAKIFVAKKRLIRLTFKELDEYMTGMVALIFTNENPFKLASTLRKNRTKAPAKPGQIAQDDIVVKAGPTSFAPGPIIGELSDIGIKTGVENGKVAIKNDSVVVKKGEVISKKVADLLTRLDIKPMEIGLQLKAAYEDGVIFSGDILNIDESEYIEMLRNASKESYGLALELSYPAKETIKPLISKAYKEGTGIALSQNIFVPELIDRFIARAERAASALMSIKS